MFPYGAANTMTEPTRAMSSATAMHHVRTLFSFKQTNVMEIMRTNSSAPLGIPSLCVLAEINVDIGRTHQCRFKDAVVEVFNDEVTKLYI